MPPKRTKAQQGPQKRRRRVTQEAVSSEDVEGASSQTQRIATEVTSMVIQTLAAQGLLPRSGAQMMGNHAPLDVTPQSPGLHTQASGSQTPMDITGNEGAHQSVSHPLGSLLPQRVKERIWANEYVDMQEVLYPNCRPNSIQKSSVDPPSQLPHGEWQPSASYKRLADINLWQKGMEIMAAVITEREAVHAPHLFLYMANVKKMEQRGGDWEMYDQVFRMRRQTTLKPWNMIDWEVWNDCMAAPKSGTKNKDNEKSEKPSKSSKKYTPAQKFAMSEARKALQAYVIPKGYCWLYLAAKECAGCDFIHSCPWCPSAHPVTKCKKPEKKAAIS